MTKITEEMAIALSNSGWWNGIPAVVVAEFQLNERLLCMPWGEFHKAVEKALKRPVWSHEFALREELLDELRAVKAGAEQMDPSGLKNCFEKIYRLTESRPKEQKMKSKEAIFRTKCRTIKGTHFRRAMEARMELDAVGYITKDRAVALLEEAEGLSTGLKAMGVALLAHEAKARGEDFGILDETIDTMKDVVEDIFQLEARASSHTQNREED